MRCLVLLMIAVAGRAQEVPQALETRATIPAGVPLRVALEKRVAIKRVGEPILGKLIEPVYVFDRAVLPAGSSVEGHIAEIGGVPAARRAKAILSGNFTPPREVRAQFDTLVLSDGSRLSLSTLPSKGTAHTARVAKPQSKQQGRKSALRGVRDKVEEMDRAAIAAFTTPGKMSRLKSALTGMLPYHRQSWSVGTLFNGVLLESLTAPTAPAAGQIEALAPTAAEPETQEVRARLLTEITSRTARRGDVVEAAVTRPLFSADHRLLIPEGSRLLGDVVEARGARWLHRNGKLLFVFRQIKLPQGTGRSVQGYLEGVEADFNSHLALDSEGAARARSPKSRFIFPAIAVAVAGLSLHQDYNEQGVPDQDIAGRAESGAVGLGLVGTLVAQTSRTLASGIAFTGAGFSVYSTFIVRGQEVVLPANTPVTISLRTRGEPTGEQPAKRRPN